MVSLISSCGGYINERNSANLGLLIDKTSSIYLYVKLKAVASWIFSSFTRFWKNSDRTLKKNILQVKINFLRIFFLTLHIPRYYIILILTVNSVKIRKFCSISWNPTICLLYSEQKKMVLCRMLVRLNYYISLCILYMFGCTLPWTCYPLFNNKSLSNMRTICEFGTKMYVSWLSCFILTVFTIYMFGCTMPWPSVPPFW